MRDAAEKDERERRETTVCACVAGERASERASGGGGCRRSRSAYENRLNDDHPGRSGASGLRAAVFIFTAPRPAPPPAHSSSAGPAHAPPSSSCCCCCCCCCVPVLRLESRAFHRYRRTPVERGSFAHSARGGNFFLTRPFGNAAVGKLRQTAWRRDRRRLACEWKRIDHAALGFRRHALSILLSAAHAMNPVLFERCFFFFLTLYIIFYIIIDFVKIYNKGNSRVSLHCLCGCSLHGFGSIRFVLIRINYAR